ncbi:endonuclease/exonuclease/phosphatase family protein [Roseinatronobacter monicus]|uniref:Endonuclease/exonuclease/phosphatase family metal-dependent hydrolase n=1 Tax=Roseinatronobacter monicus TaxID=393481 RepID=A0A543KDS8_9RHOB|nr:endonuclease/exonuclease/phosphatase family protein [Roseinatronobacter monicus]TQM93229.1 endonuclease/exonuclease/phosphatase family metal-dependent hydrolase [Roseinatronobacter monicus]
MSDLIVSSYNIHKAVGTDMRRDPTRTVQVIREIGADIVALQEVDRRFGDRRGVLDPEMLHSVTGLVPVALTDRLGARAHGWHGNLLLLHGGAEVEEARAVTLPGLEPRGAIVADIRINGQPLRVITAHLGLLHQSRLLQARFLSKVIEEGDGRPTLVMGDFNEWRLGAGCSLMPLRRELRAVKRSAQTIASFPAQMPVLPLDRIIGCRRAEIGDLRIHDSILARKASDHLPIRAALNLPRVQSAVM